MKELPRESVVNTGLRDSDTEVCSHGRLPADCPECANMLIVGEKEGEEEREDVAE